MKRLAVLQPNLNGKMVTTKRPFQNKSVVCLFLLPGAFTPTCSTSHLPRFRALLRRSSKAKAWMRYLCSVNDAFVMYQGGKKAKMPRMSFLASDPAMATSLAKIGHACVKKDQT